MAPKQNDLTFSPATHPTAVIGSGTLGSRIALMLASSGGEVRLYDLNAEQLEVARRYVEAELPRVVAGRPGTLPGRLVLSRTVQAAVADTWMVVEAIPERLDLKRKVFGDLDRLAPEDAILASNSSSYPTSEFIDAVSRPGRVANTHYYGGLPEVNVVEVMSCGKTTDEVMACLFERLPAYGLLPFHVLKESVGFIYNRIWAAIKRESLAVVAEGVSTPEIVDQLFQSILGSRDGPFRIMDKVGLDVVLDIEEHYAAVRPGIPAEPRQLLKRFVEQGHLGIKSGKGFYSDYEEKAPTR
ncbi:MAG: 3-hydroxyacyl-CoA dehydrogenase family protein [Verrucomicrobia bacterium]|nr:3-hydroxyacyl-CoA dehydrogenase family protein [Verrucomicrobiota bacterium]